VQLQATFGINVTKGRYNTPILPIHKKVVINVKAFVSELMFSVQTPEDKSIGVTKMETLQTMFQLFAVYST